MAPWLLERFSEDPAGGQVLYLHYDTSSLLDGWRMALKTIDLALVALPLPSCVTMQNLPDLSEPQSPQLPA